MIEKIFDKELYKQQKQQVEFDFDFYSWLKDENQPIDDFINHCEYEFSIDLKKIEFFKKELNVISAATPEIALGKYLMQQVNRSFNVFENNHTKIN